LDDSVKRAYLLINALFSEFVRQRRDPIKLAIVDEGRSLIQTANRSNLIVLKDNLTIR